MSSPILVLIDRARLFLHLAPIIIQTQSGPPQPHAYQLPAAPPVSPSPVALNKASSSGLDYLP